MDHHGRALPAGHLVYNCCEWKGIGKDFGENDIQSKIQAIFKFEANETK